MVECNVLKFGSFTLKSGRKSPFFMNAGAYITGSQLERLGEFYAKAIHDNFGDDFDVLFGPAYKGIPLSVATCIAYSKLYNKEIKYCADRKEEKDHGADKGSLLGYGIKDGDRVVIIEDVTTSGKSIEETYPKIKAQETAPGGIKIVGEIVSLNRMERAADSTKSALQVISEKYGFPAKAIVSMKEVVETLYTPGKNGVITDELKKEIDAYYAEWGADF
jgi:orotate phosphoribosyltransferase